MNKKFMNALLFSAALLSSGVIATSCKDYDDDIDELRNQDQAVKDDLNQKLDAVNSTISSLTSAQDGLKSDIAAAQKAAQDAQASADEAAKAAADAKTAALEGIDEAAKTAADNLAAAKQELEEAIQKGDNATAEEIDVINKDLETIKGNISALLAFQGTTENTLNALKEADSKLNETVSGLTDTVNELAKIVGNAEAGLVSQVAALEEYQKTNDAAVEGIQEELAGLKAQVDKWKGLDPEQLEAMDAEIKAAQEDITELNGKIATINENLATLYIAVYKGITHIEMVYGMQNAESGKTYASSELELLSDIAVRSYTFGTNQEKHNELNPKETMANAVEFVEGERRRLSETLLVRVTPADAALSASEISLVDTKGTDLIKEGYVQVTDVKKFEGTGVATRAAQNENGLYEITIEVGAKADDTSFDFEKSFESLTTLNGHDVMFALGVNQAYNGLKDNANTTAGVRKVTTSYELTFSENRRAEASNILFSVYETNNREATEKTWSQINNRWDNTATEAPYEYTWKENVEAEPTFEKVDANFNASIAGYMSSDLRKSRSYFPIAPSTDFTVELDMDAIGMAGVKYFYISLDRDFAIESDDSELTAWNTYQSNIIGDIDKVLDVDACGGKATLNINIPKLNDVIGFRIFAINSDGSYVDPDGKAFYVEVGNAATSIDAVASTVTINPYDRAEGMFSDYVPVTWEWPATLTDAEGAVAWALNSEMTEHIYSVNDNTLIQNMNIFDVHFYDANKREITRFSNGDAWNDVKFIRTEFAVGAGRLVDDHTYTGTVTMKDSEGRILATMPVSATKKLPTDAPEEFSAKANQIVAGVHKSYLEPINNGEDGSVNMNRVFNALEGDSHYIFTFEDALTDGRDTKDLVVKDEYGTGGINAYVVEVEREFIDNTTPHATKVEYDWGDISFKYNEVIDACEVRNHTVVAEEFETIFSCIYNPAIMKWSWQTNTNTNLVYETEYTASNTKMKRANINGKNSFNNTDFSKTLQEIVTEANPEFGSAIDRMDGNYKSIALYTDVNNESTKNEYFEPSIDAQGNILFKVTKHGDYNNPTADVKSTLRIVYVDIFGHDVTIDLDVTVKKR